MNVAKMKKGEIIQILVPAKIKIWKDKTPKHKHDGKEKYIAKMYWGWKKSDLIQEYESLKSKGYIK